MSWGLLAQQFCLEIGFGLLLALAFVPRAPVGAFFYRLMGTCAALPLAAALCARVRAGTAWSDPVVLGTTAALLAYPFFSGPARGKRWVLGLGAGLLGSALATGWVVRTGLPALTPLGQLIATLSSLATGAVAGSVGLAMVL